MIKITTLIFYLMLISCATTIFAATNTNEGANWTDLLLKTFNFVVFAGLIWFFFGKKIIIALRTLVKNDYDVFFSVLKRKKELERKLQELQENFEKEQKKHSQMEKTYFREIDLEKDRVQKESELYCQKLKKNNIVILDQEYKAAKRALYKKIFYRALEILEQNIKDKKILISKEKYLSNFLNKVQQTKI